MSHKLTATIITLNEARNIERCIDALKPIADEIIVLDSFSTDATAEICKSKGVRFEQRKWEGYTATKNHLNGLASHPYIFSIDADEAPDENLQEAIAKQKKESFSGVYEVNRLTNYCGKWIYNSGWYPDYKIRIFPKEGCYWEGEYVHESLFIPENLKKHSLSGHLLHYSYYSYEEHKERADHYSKLTAQKMHAQGRKASVLKPYLSGLGRFLAMYLFKKGFLDGKMGWKIASISAASNVFKYKELRRLNHE